MIKLNIQLTENDYIKFNYWYSRVTLLAFNVSYSILITLLVILTFLVPKNAPINILLIVILIGFLMYFYAAIYFRSKKIFASDAFLHREQAYEITPDAITVSSERSHAIIKWDEIYQFIESKEYLYIFIAKNKAFLLPKRVIDDAAVTELCQLATANMPAKKLKLRK